MINLIPLLRADRLREINEYKAKDYIFRSGQDRYSYVRNITVSNMSNQGVLSSVKPVTYSFQIRNNHTEPRFYINNRNESCTYLTIYEIYEILNQLAGYLSTDIVKTLTSKRNKTWYINYTGLEFELDFFSELIFNEKLIIPESNIEISLENLFVLIALIQDKSNYYWSISTEENREKYSEGILRLISCLIATKGHSILKKHGWIYKKNENKYILLNNNTYTKKYYLTQKEFENIMEVKS